MKSITFDTPFDHECQSMIKEWDREQIKKKREECKSWWQQYKSKLQEDIFNKINS